MTLEDAIKNREDCLKYLEGLGQKASPQKVLKTVEAMAVRRGLVREE